MDEQQHRLQDAIAKELYDSIPDDPFQKVMFSDGFEVPYSVSWEWALLNHKRDERIRRIWDQAGRIVSLIDAAQPGPCEVAVPEWVSKVLGYQNDMGWQVFVNHYAYSSNGHAHHGNGPTFTDALQCAIAMDDKDIATALAQDGEPTT